MTAPAWEAVAKARRSLEHSRLFATQHHSTRERQEMARDVVDRVEQAFAALAASTPPTPVTPAQVLALFNGLRLGGSADVVGSDSAYNDGARDMCIAVERLLESPELPLATPPAAPHSDTRDAERWRYFRERAWVGTDEDGEVCAGVSFGISEEADGLTDAERATLANNTFSDDHDTADVCDRLVDAALPSNPSGEQHDG